MELVIHGLVELVECQRIFLFTNSMVKMARVNDFLRWADFKVVVDRISLPTASRRPV